MQKGGRLDGGLSPRPSARINDRLTGEEDSGTGGAGRTDGAVCDLNDVF